MHLDLYDDPALYDARSQPEPFASFYTAICVQSSGPVLELGCGTGQIILPIARAGCESWGLDRSLPMLRAARAKETPDGPAVRWVEGDMRNFSLGTRFGVIVIARNTLLQLTGTSDLRACLRSARDHLLPGGRLVFDIFNPDVRILAAAPENRVFVRRFVDPRWGEVTLELASGYDAATQVNRGTWFHSTAAQKDFLVTPIHLRSIFPQELPVLLEAESLQLLDRWGDFDRRPFGSDSRFQVCVAARA